MCASYPTGYGCESQNEFFSQCMPMPTDDDDCSEGNTQCGGEGYAGTTCCKTGFECTETNAYYSGCTPLPFCANGFFGQCGGLDAKGNKWLEDNDDCCPTGYACEFQTEYYSQCLLKE